MPKKAKKGGKKGKGSKKSGKKGKSSDKKDKAKKESPLKTAAINSDIWEARLHVTEASKKEFQEIALKLVDQNTELKDVLQSNEKDTIEVITHMRRQIEIKDDEIHKLKEELRDTKRENCEEKEQLIGEMSEQIMKMEEQLVAKTNENQLMQNELKMIKKFRKERNQMQKEFEEIKEALYVANKDHQDVLGKMEKKFFEEKMRLQYEANQKISELADHAHAEAIANLDEATKSVFKENVRANEALKYHIADAERSKHKLAKLQTQNAELAADKHMLDTMVAEKIAETRSTRTQLQQLHSKVEILELALSQSVKEFNLANQTLIDKHVIALIGSRMTGSDWLQSLKHHYWFGRFYAEQESARKELVKLQRLVTLKNAEFKKVQSLAKSVVTQRSELETFFLDSLELVKKEIAESQLQYRKDAQMVYQQKMLAAHQGKAEYPPIRTFGKSDNNNSTNSVYRDLEAAMHLFNVSGNVDIADLTWEQREKVLRYLFARMNRGNAAGSNKTSPPSSSPANAAGNVVLPPLTLDPQHPNQLTGSVAGGAASATQTGGNAPSFAVSGSLVDQILTELPEESIVEFEEKPKTGGGVGFTFVTQSETEEEPKVKIEIIE